MAKPSVAATLRKSGDQKLASQHQNHDPGRHEVGREADEKDQSGGDQKFVRHGVQQHSHAADLAVFARQVAVESVGDGGKNEDSGGQQLLLTGTERCWLDSTQIKKGIQAILLKVIELGRFNKSSHPEGGKSRRQIMRDQSGEKQRIQADRRLCTVRTDSGRSPRG